MLVSLALDYAACLVARASMDSTWRPNTLSLHLFPLLHLHGTALLTPPEPLSLTSQHCNLAASDHSAGNSECACFVSKLSKQERQQKRKKGKTQTQTQAHRHPRKEMLHLRMEGELKEDLKKGKGNGGKQTDKQVATYRG